MEGITGKAGVRFSGKQYADLANSVKLNAFASIFLELGYAFSREFLLTFKVDNLLNRKNYIWQNYQENPFEMTAGVSFQW